MTMPLDIVELTSIRDVRSFHVLDVKIAKSTAGDVGVVLVDKSGKAISEWLDHLFFGPALVHRLRATFPRKSCPWHGNRRDANPQDCTCAAVLTSRIEAALREITDAVGGTR